MDAACEVAKAFGFPVLEVGMTANGSFGPSWTEENDATTSANDYLAVESDASPRTQVSLADLALPHLGLPLAITDSPFPLLLGVPCVARNTPRVATVSSAAEGATPTMSAAPPSSSFLSRTQSRASIHSLELIQSILGLDRPSLILYHHLTAGTDALAPLGGAGHVIALGLAKSGFGTSLARIVESAKMGEDGVDQLALDRWRDDLAAELASNSLGLLPRRAPSLASSLPPYFPNLHAFAQSLYPSLPPGLTQTSISSTRALLEPDLWWGRDPDSLIDSANLIRLCGARAGWSRAKVQLELEKAGAWEGRELFRARATAHAVTSSGLKIGLKGAPKEVEDHMGKWNFLRRQTIGGFEGVVVEVRENVGDFLRPTRAKDRDHTNKRTKEGQDGVDDNAGPRASLRIEKEIAQVAMPEVLARFEVKTTRVRTTILSSADAEEKDTVPKRTRKKRTVELEASEVPVVQESSTVKKPRARRIKSVEVDSMETPLPELPKTVKKPRARRIKSVEVDSMETLSSEMPKAVKMPRARRIKSVEEGSKETPLPELPKTVKKPRAPRIKSVEESSMETPLPELLKKRERRKLSEEVQEDELSELQHSARPKSSRKRRNFASVVDYEANVPNANQESSAEEVQQPSVITISRERDFGGGIAEKILMNTSALEEESSAPKSKRSRRKAVSVHDDVELLLKPETAEIKERQSRFGGARRKTLLEDVEEPDNVFSTESDTQGSKSKRGKIVKLETVETKEPQVQPRRARKRNHLASFEETGQGTSTPADVSESQLRLEKAHLILDAEVDNVSRLDAESRTPSNAHLLAARVRQKKATTDIQELKELKGPSGRNITAGQENEEMVLVVPSRIPEAESAPPIAAKVRKGRTRQVNAVAAASNHNTDSSPTGESIAADSGIPEAAITTRKRRRGTSGDEDAVAAAYDDSTDSARKSELMGDADLQIPESNPAATRTRKRRRVQVTRPSE
ncbi:hypothetical protein HDU93_001324 [Gonapodya sp. JEL0774]|nr:hypothetical protein HDU93_001324 [Gonapodya sp. JEL0774]